MSQYVESGTPVNLSSSGTVSKVSGTLIGYYVNSTNSGTIQILNGSTSGGTAIGAAMTPAIGFHYLGAYLTSGCYATIGGIALDVTLFFAAG